MWYRVDAIHILVGVHVLCIAELEMWSTSFFCWSEGTFLEM